jgi:hypothetical protein
MGQPAPTGPLQLVVTFDRREYATAHWAAMKRGPLLRRPVVRMSAAVVGGLLLVQASGALHPLVQVTAPLGVRAVVAVLGANLVVYGIWRGSRLTREQECHEAHPDTYTLSDAGLEISGVDDLPLMSWSSMTRVHEMDRFFLFVAGSEVQYLPKRVLDAAQRARVRSLIAHRAPAPARVLPARKS